MRLIDADALVEELHKHFGIRFDENEWWNSSHVLTAIACTSTVDAIPIKWLYKQSDNPDRSDAFRNACDSVAMAWMAERKEE